MSTFYIQWSENLSLEKIKIIKEICEKNIMRVKSKRKKYRSSLEKRYTMPFQAAVFSRRRVSKMWNVHIYAYSTALKNIYTKKKRVKIVDIIH